MDDRDDLTREQQLDADILRAMRCMAAVFVQGCGRSIYKKRVKNNLTCQSGFDLILKLIYRGWCKIMRRFITFTIMCLMIIMTSCVSFVDRVDPSEFYNYPEDSEFIFLERKASFQKYGYYLISQPDALEYKVDYDVLCNKKGRIIDRNYVFANGKFIKVIIEDGSIYYCKKFSEATEIEGIAYLKDIDKAKSMIGSNIWINKNYQDQLLLENGQSIEIKNIEQVKIVNVSLKLLGGAGTFYLVVEKSNKEQGLVYFTEKAFFDKNPIKKNWPRRFVDAIEQQHVVIGMNKEQAILAWGAPEEINTTSTAYGSHEQWVYGSNYIYFDDDKLSAIQN